MSKSDSLADALPDTPADPPAAGLDRIELLRPLSADQRAAVARQCRWRRFGPDEQLIDHWAETRDVAFVVEGQVRVLSHSAGGREISFSDIDAGELVGEMSALDGRPRSASVVALEEGALVAFLPAKPFQTLVTAHPELAMAMMLRLCDKLRGATDRIMELSTLGANNRVHAELLRLARRAARQGASAIITPIPVHSDIAARVSTTRETVARVLSDLTRDGMLERRSDALVVRDLPRLELLVEDVRGGA
ncbi:cAMP-binding domain of CRP or a regulatory subunit of cAMP-dependent protein kinases [Azospirillum oryzae]|uniref:cAMP-binding domain of CRP or a regulatory subunit of cAMP-dependent protein kinases n=1 Tax=Azospirillum oryzae TaxID=286727 RepID=A0A1X7GQV1_9PROT|nr:Crp/Fnr family transcriptional regulator [Azospirillum oryzae]SMF73389.1 cAMP-binding domain of CRP or a regulatory subunit of cAMP-dependent protein kinases [Azospirillum oryzae]